MRKAAVHQLVVRGKRGRVVGVIGAADVRAAPVGAVVGDFMSRRLVIVRPGTDVGSAAALMRANAIGSLPVLKRTRLVGIVTVSDMLDVVDDANGLIRRTTKERSIVPKAPLRSTRPSRRSPTVFHNILVATDLTPGSAGAVTCARRLANDERARLHVLYVIPDPVMRAYSVEAYGDDRNLRLDKARRKALRQMSALSPRGANRNHGIEPAVAVGEAADQIVGYASRNDIDLIVIGTRARRDGEDVVTGSTAGRIVDLAPCPVLTVLSGKSRRRPVAA
jgi:nucleotide-binding universal stress UspA family protein